MKAGFSLVEMTIALAIVLVVTGAVFAVMNPAYGPFHSQPEAIDMAQRFRVSVDAIARDLMMAGAGTRKYFPSVLPFRRGPLARDSTSRVFRRSSLTPLCTRRCCRDNAQRAHGRWNIVYVASSSGFAAERCWWRFSMRQVHTTRSASTAIQDAPPAFVHAGAAFSKTYASGRDRRPRGVGDLLDASWTRLRARPN